MADGVERVVGADDDLRVMAWLASLLDAKVVSWAPQPRWRPMWFVDVDRAGRLERVVVRGERSDTPLVFPLEHEMLFQRLLGEHGIPVPQVYGWCDAPLERGRRSVAPHDRRDARASSPRGRADRNGKTQTPMAARSKLRAAILSIAARSVLGRLTSRWSSGSGWS